MDFDSEYPKHKKFEDAATGITVVVACRPIHLQALPDGAVRAADMYLMLPPKVSRRFAAKVGDGRPLPHDGIIRVASDTNAGTDSNMRTAFARFAAKGVKFNEATKLDALRYADEFLSKEKQTQRSW